MHRGGLDRGRQQHARGGAHRCSRHMGVLVLGGAVQASPAIRMGLRPILSTINKASRVLTTFTPPMMRATSRAARSALPSASRNRGR